MANTKTGKPTKTRRTQRPMTVRVVRVEPSDLARAAIARVWVRLLEERKGAAPVPSRAGKESA